MKRSMFFGFLNSKAQKKNEGMTNHNLETMNLIDTKGISLVMVVTIIQRKMQ